MDIRITDVWQRVGRRTGYHQVPAETLVGRRPADEFLLVLHWPVTASYIDLTVKCGADRFTEVPTVVLEMLEEYEIPQERVPSALLKNRSHCRARIVRHDDPITLEIWVNTDDPDFTADAGESEESGLNREIEILAVAPPVGGPPRIEVAALHVHLDPADPMEKYDGYVAIDLGNTNSTIVNLKALGGGKARDIEVLRVEQTNDPGPIPTAVRITGFAPAPEDRPDGMEQADCLVGNDAMGDSPGDSLVLGAKRILANVDPDARHDFWLGGERYMVRKTLPAELFLSKLFRAFHREKFHVPRKIAITHPTTFLPREIEQLRQAVIQGWRRSLGAESRVFDASKLVNPELPQLIIDEASAAAFYFLYLDFIDVPGGLDRLHYLYPDGLNLLVYDCGGGTTDIALVNAHVQHGKAKKGQRSARLSIEVLGRTGHRTFGGDNITIAAFRVLRARLASRLLGAGKLPYPEIPDEVDRLPSFLSDHDSEIVKAVPTRFDRKSLGRGDQRRRRDITDLLWRWAEQFKIKLGRESPVKLSGSGLIKDLTAHHREASTPGMEDERIFNALQGIEIHREEIDVLIRDDLEESIEYANNMILAKLGKPEAHHAESKPGETRPPVKPEAMCGDVHLVYVVGNASKYPTVREAIEKHLKVPFLADRLVKVGGDDLKNSVAKGAALALHVTSQAQAMGISFDQDLNKKLPYDITFRYGIAGGHKDIYREHQDFSQLTEQNLPVPEWDGLAEAKDRNRVTLWRRWPGDEEPKPFLDFQFRGVIQGPLAVLYDTSKHCFRMRDEGGGDSAVDGQEIEKATYVAPVQSGEL